MLCSTHNIDPSYNEFFKDNELLIRKLLGVILRRGRFYPSRENIFRALLECSMKDVKVIIVGQDPYKNSDHACGLSFSLPPGIPPTASLRNMYACIKKSYPSFVIPNHGDLRPWCKQGVLLLNMCLAYFPDNPQDATESRFCMPFVSKLIKEIANINPELILVMWGKKAQDLDQISGLPGTVTKLKGVHPSSMNGKRFVEEVNHFKEINQILDTPIVWDL